MDLYVLNSDFEQIALIDDYRSLIWAKRYYQFGDCEVYIRACAEYFDILRKGHFMLRNDDDMICRIEKVELDTDAEDGNFLIVTGVDCRNILNQRVIWDQTNFTGTVEKYIHRLIENNLTNPDLPERKFDNFYLGEIKGLPATISEQVTYTALGDKIIELCTAYQYGSRVRIDENNRLIFEVYVGEDRSYNQDKNNFVVFSHEFDNIISSKYITDSTNVKNVAVVAGEGEGIERKRVTFGQSAGRMRYELYVDARDISSTVEEGETIDYNALLIARGIEALAEYGVVESFEGEVEPHYSYKYGIDYHLGDIVQVINEYGISSCVRITEVIETFDQDGYSVIPTFQYQEVAE